MSKFRKKPVVIDAVLWTGSRLEPSAPEWMKEALHHTPADVGGVMRIGDTIHIGTLEGVMAASPGDWIIRGIKGELYPCKPDIFAASYEPVEVSA